MVLKIVSGINKGLIIPLSSHLVFGRSKGDIVLRDELVSDPHAEIECLGKHYFLKDLNSKEGIIHEGEKVSRLVLQEGVTFQIGSVKFLVQKGKKEEKISDSSELQTRSFESEKDEEFLEKILHHVEDKPKEIKFLEKSIKLKFEKGIQKGLVWELAYLPREVGSQDADLPLIYFALKNISFKLDLQKNKIFFSTKDKDFFLVNYKPVEKVELKEQDLIIAWFSYIRVLMN